MIAGTRGDSIRRIWMDFTARRYDTFSETFEIKYMDENDNIVPLDLTDCTAQMHIKKKKGDGDPVLVMDVAVNSDNELVISKNHLLMDLAKGRYWHDIEIKDADDTHITWIEGRFIVIEHVTQYLDEIEQFFEPFFNGLLKIFTIPKTVFTALFEQEITLTGFVRYLLKSGIPFRSKLSFTTILLALFKATLIFANKLIFEDSTKIKYKTIFLNELHIVTTVSVYYNCIFANKITFPSMFSSGS